MSGILAIWNDCAPGGETHYERWYKSEHMQERVGGPGFRFGRRYERLSGDRQFFTFYEVDSPDVLSAPAYMKQLGNPTPGTLKATQSFRNNIRTVCDLRFAAGDLIGSHAVVLRADGAMAPTAGVGELVRNMAEEPGIARVQLWTASTKQTPTDTAEMKRRAKDQLVAGAFVVECVRRQDAERIAGQLAGDAAAALGVAGPSAVGVYSLLCVYLKPGSPTQS
jgi:hypothetical protein